jgi:hypothetical protein
MRPKRAVHTLVAILAVTVAPTAQESPNAGHQDHNAMHDAQHEMHAAGPAVSFAELKATVDQLNRALVATERYRDVRAARDDGYKPIGPYVNGMGYHYVKGRRPDAQFDIDHPPILLYEKDVMSLGGLRLVGVSYIFNAPADADGQPVGAPFPPALAKWHKHANLCLMPDSSVETQLDVEECGRRGGRFSAETQWMIHAWIWKDSAAGVFSPFNSAVR